MFVSRRPRGPYAVMSAPAAKKASRGPCARTGRACHGIRAVDTETETAMPPLLVLFLKANFGQK